MPKLNFVKLMCLNWDCLIVHNLIELTILLKDHLRSAALWILAWSWVHRLTHVSNQTLPVTRSDLFSWIIFFIATLCWVEISAYIACNISSTGDNRRIIFISHLARVHSCVATLHRSIGRECNSILLGIVWNNRWSCSALSGGVKRFILSLLLLVIEQCLLIHLLLFFSYYPF